MSADTGKLQKFVAAYLYGVGAEKPDTWAEDLSRLIVNGLFAEDEAAIREKIAQDFDIEADILDQKVQKYGVLGMGAMYAHDRDTARRNAQIVRQPL